MKKIEAIIRKTKFEDVKEALLEAEIEWFSYYDVRGIGKTRQGRIYRGVVYDTSSIERILVSAKRMWTKPFMPFSRLLIPARSVTDVSSSYPLKMPSASVQENVEILPCTMQNKRNNSLHTPVKTTLQSKNHTTT